MVRYSTLILIIILLVAILAGAPAVNAQGGWQCQWTVVNGPVTGGYISGRGCIRYPDPYSMSVWADTYLSASVPPTWIYTRVIGYDNCGGGPWSQRASTDHYDGPNVTYGTSGVATGGIQNCGQFGHGYRVEGWHEKLTGSTWEGYSGNVYW